jgi:hypothetical protein
MNYLGDDGFADSVICGVGSEGHLISKLGQHLIWRGSSKNRAPWASFPGSFNLPPCHRSEFYLGPTKFPFYDVEVV